MPEQIAQGTEDAKALLRQRAGTKETWKQDIERYPWLQCTLFTP